VKHVGIQGTPKITATRGQAYKLPVLRIIPRS